MSSLHGSSRMPTGFSVPETADEKLQAMLALYKSPATIRDMKQVFFYKQISSLSTNIDYNYLYYNMPVGVSNIGDPNGPIDNYGENQVGTNAVYFANIGTQVQMDISTKVNDLMDIRVPKDKYVVEISLIECTIESDPTGWVRIPDKVYRINQDGDVVEEPCYLYKNNAVDATNVPNDQPPPATIANPVPPRQNLGDTLIQATKRYQPQTLFCRIKELSNGEPYNWSVTNSGSFTIDKSHQLLIRHGDVNYSNLTLEYGHMAFQGKDEDQFRNWRKDPNLYDNIFLTADSAYLNYLPEKKEETGYVKYYDYNQEYFNAIQRDSTALYSYPTFYFGNFERLAGEQGTYDLPIGTGAPFPQDYANFVANRPATNIVEPSDRPPFRFIDKSDIGGGDPDSKLSFNLQGSPLFYNQNVGKLNFRFLIRVIHLF